MSRQSLKQVRALVAAANARGIDTPAVREAIAMLQEQADYRRTRCRATGTYIIVSRAEDAGAVADGSSWQTVCDTHSSVVCHPSKALALSHAASPSWCPKCQDIMNGKAPKHPTGIGSDDDMKAEGEE